MQKKMKKEITSLKEIKIDKISIFFKKSILKSILKILTMEHGGFRTFKSVKNINRLFSNIDLDKYKTSNESKMYIWAICFFSKQWLDGITSPELIWEIAKTKDEYNNIIDEIITNSINDKNIITAPEAKALFDLISEALQFGFLVSLKDEYVNLLDDIDMNEPGSFKQIVDRLFLISQSLLDIKHNTNMVANKIEFNTGDMDSIKEAISSTYDSISNNFRILKTGIRRLNTLLSPGYMNGRLYTYLGLPASYKSGILLKSTIDIRKYNPGYQPKTPGMKPCVLYITMENTFTETIERIWNMIFDEPMINYDLDEVIEKLTYELGIAKILNDANIIKDVTPGSENKSNPEKEKTLASLLNESDKKKLVPNIEIVIQYYPYKSISTDDLYVIINDLKEQNMEVCALVFDYIKRIEPAVPVKDNLRLELDHIINELKALAVILDIPVITAHQMNRAAATIIDNAARSGKTDTNKLVGRENTGDSWSIIETSDWVSVLNCEYKPGTDQKYLTINNVKRRRIDMAEAEFAKYTYLAHPFAKNSGLRLLDDIHLDKVLSLQSLTSDIDISNQSPERINAAPRLQTIKQNTFEDDF